MNHIMNICLAILITAVYVDLSLKINDIKATIASNSIETKNDIWNSKLTPDDLCYDYVKLKESEQATASQHKFCN